LDDASRAGGLLLLLLKLLFDDHSSSVESEAFEAFVVDINYASKSSH
jgi:hypothetical protein